MRGITEKAVNDIYRHISNVNFYCFELNYFLLLFLTLINNHPLIILQTPERDFTIRISGLEIYNENVRDLLNTESGRNLKLLDDPEVLFIITCVRIKGSMLHCVNSDNN